MKLPLKFTKSLSLREIALLSVLAAILIVSQVAMSVLPNIELVSLLIIVYTRVYGVRVFYPIAVFVVLQGFIYGFHLWFINYLYVWAILAVVTLLLRRKASHGCFVLLSTAFGLLFGALCSPPYLFIGGVPAMISYFVAGIPFDILHGIGNLFIAAILMKPIYRLLTDLNRYLSI